MNASLSAPAAIRAAAIAGTVLWTLVVAASLGWGLTSNRQQSLDIARHEAAAYIDKDIAFRSWATSHGGVYVPPTAKTPPNRYLTGVPERDVVTTTGKQLTLMNPAYMLREVQTHFGGPLGERGHITSLKPLNPDNAPDAWEAAALRRFENGERDVWEIVSSDGGDQLRLMRPFVIEQGCLKCHGQQGYKLGDIRGGIAVTLSLAPFAKAAQATERNLLFGHGAIWLAGLCGIVLINRLARRYQRDGEAARAALLKSSNEIHDLYDHAPCGYHSLDKDGCFVRINQTELDWLGYHREEVVGILHFDELLDAEGRDLFKRSFPRFLQDGQISGLEFKLRRKDGSYLPVLISATALRNTAGTYLMSRSSVFDMSERKHIESELRASEARLNEAQRIAHLGNWELDLISNRLTWSDEIFRIFEIDPQQFGASYDAFLAAIHPDDRERVNHAYEDSVANRQPYDIVHRLQMADGRIKFVNERCETTYDAAGKPLRSAGTVHDITALKLTEDALRALNQELEQRVAHRTAQLEAANQELEAFAYSVSHDLRAPLRAVDGFSKILMEDYAAELNDDARRLLGMVRNNALRMGQLISDILDFSRSSRQEIAKTSIDLGKLAAEVFAEQQAAVPQRTLQFIQGELPPAWGDRALLRQVLANLLSNAVKFTGRQAEARIMLDGAIELGECHYRICDNGAGFDMHYVDKLFGIFERLHTREEFEGTGIGLAIVKRIVTRHGGRVWAEGKPDQGACFHFTLPCAGGTNE